jgi:hypothetical protein
VYRKPFGVWFSLALAILALSTWSGWKLGERIAVYWYHHQQQKLGAEQGRFESMLSVLDGLQTTELFASALAASSGKELELGKYLRAEITELERLKGRPDYHEIKPLLEMHLALAYANTAIAEEQSGHKDLADSDMKSAQALFQSLGWKDYSTDALRIAGKRELDLWNPQARTKERGK